MSAYAAGGELARDIADEARKNGSGEKWGKAAVKGAVGLGVSTVIGSHAAGSAAGHLASNVVPSSVANEIGSEVKGIAIVTLVGAASIPVALIGAPVLLAYGLFHGVKKIFS